MTCEDFLIAQETGGPVARWRARRHAAHCPRCAALAAKLAVAKQALATPESLSPRAKWLWKQAAEQPAARPARSWNRGFLAFGLAVTACAILLAIWLRLTRFQPTGPVKPPSSWAVTPKPPARSPVVVIDIDPNKELTRLSDAVDQLDTQIKDLRADAQRAEARRQIAMTFDRFDKW